jgi:hypothetical protein
MWWRHRSRFAFRLLSASPVDSDADLRRATVQYQLARRQRSARLHDDHSAEGGLRHDGVGTRRQDRVVCPVRNGLAVLDYRREERGFKFGRRGRRGHRSSGANPAYQDVAGRLGPFRSSPRNSCVPSALPLPPTFSLQFPPDVPRWKAMVRTGRRGRASFATCVGLALPLGVRARCGVRPLLREVGQFGRSAGAATVTPGGLRPGGLGDPGRLEAEATSTRPGLRH